MNTGDLRRTASLCSLAHNRKLPIWRWRPRAGENDALDVSLKRRMETAKTEVTPLYAQCWLSSIFVASPRRNARQIKVYDMLKKPKENLDFVLYARAFKGK